MEPATLLKDNKLCLLRIFYWMAVMKNVSCTQCFYPLRLIPVQNFEKHKMAAKHEQHITPPGQFATFSHRAD